MDHKKGVYGFFQQDWLVILKANFSETFDKERFQTKNYTLLSFSVI